MKVEEFAAKGGITHPVIEIFGPTVQGEGPLIGMPCHFVRFGGCDYRCSWCDSKYAVLPELIAKEKEMLAPSEIADRLDALGGSAEWVILSGGNPALQHLGILVTHLHARGYRVQVETQGTVFRPWLINCDIVVVSPKPPSSGMETDFDRLDDFLGRLRVGSADLKVVVFDDEDFEFAREVHRRYPRLAMSVSVGNDYGRDRLHELIGKWRWLSEKVMETPEMGDVRALPQAHVLLWGNARGV